MSQEWITDRLPTQADGDGDGYVWMRLSPLTTMHFSVHWSYVGSAAPWQHTPSWQPFSSMANHATTETGLRQRINFLTSSMRLEREERRQERQQLLSSLRSLDAEHV
jgi:hypothetical protein